MKYALWTSILFFSVLSQAAPIENKTLQTTAPNNAFALCVMAAANTQLVHSKGQLDLLHSDISAYHANQAWLHFYVIEQSRSDVLKVVLTTLDTAHGWQTVLVAGADSYVQSTSIDDQAILRSEDGYYLGALDLSGCR